jgi:hypothetical protein
VLVDNQTITQLTQLRILNGTFLPTGFHTFVNIRREFRSKLPYPYSECLDNLKTNSSNQNKILSYFMIK